MRRVLLGLTLLAAFVAFDTPAGQLVFGEPSAEGKNIILPILLCNSADEDAVAALSLRLWFDGDLLEVVDLIEGPAALEANKQVAGNLVNPGEFVVICMGMNQLSYVDGVIAEVVFSQEQCAAPMSTEVELTRSLRVPHGSEPVHSLEDTITLDLIGCRPGWPPWLQSLVQLLRRIVGLLFSWIST